MILRRRSTARWPARKSVLPGTMLSVPLRCSAMRACMISIAVKRAGSRARWASIAREVARVVGGFAAEGGERRAEGGFGFIEAGDEGFGTGKNEAAGSGLHGEDLDGEVFEAAEGLVGLLDAFEGVVKALRVPSGGEGNQ